MTTEPFLRAPSTRAALNRLAQRNNLVVYCGAGVTRDRTGLGWVELVCEVFEHVRKQTGRNTGPDHALATALRQPGIDPAQKASAVIQAGKPMNCTETQFLTPALSKALYTSHGWSQGNLLRNVAELAVFTALLGDDVSLITTNYDDYLDRELQDFVTAYFSNAEVHEAVPGITLNIVGASAPSSTRLNKPRNGAGTIYVHHIHGRVDSSGLASGEIVFSENSYSTTRNQTVNFLASQFHEAAAFLSVGASLNDAPLIEALFRAEKTGQWSAQPRARVAVLAPSGHTVQEQQSNLTFSTLRGKHLGIEILTADSYAQVAQFVEELRICKILNGQGELTNYSSRASYPVALRDWWTAWDASAWSRNHDEHHLLLHEVLNNGIRAFLGSKGLLHPDEVLRLEMWIRRDPSVERDSRHLTQYANSTGPFYEVPALRKERIELWSNVASVRAFTAGKPLLLGLAELEHPDQATRWKAFLSVPIHYDVEIDFGAFTISRTVPVGVVTLASTLPLSEDSMHPSACFSHSELSVNDYKELLEIMSASGQLITTPNAF